VIVQFALRFPAAQLVIDLRPVQFLITAFAGNEVLKIRFPGLRALDETVQPLRKGESRLS